MSVDIRIVGLDKLTADIERIRKDASFRWPKEILDRTGEMMADAIRDEATGSLKDKVVIEETKNRRRVIVDSPHAVFVNDGTGPSPGRYVPAIGRRLVKGRRRTPKSGVVSFDIGMHPGRPATHFFDNAVRNVTPDILGYVHRKVYEYLME